MNQQYTTTKGQGNSKRRKIILKMGLQNRTSVLKKKKKSILNAHTIPEEFFEMCHRNKF